MPRVKDETPVAPEPDDGEPTGEDAPVEETAEDSTDVPTPADERIQKAFDAQAIAGAIEQVRQLIAASKVNAVLAQHGLLDRPQSGQDLHPQKFRNGIIRHRRTLELLKELWAENEASEAGLAEPSEIEIATPGQVAAVS